MQRLTTWFRGIFHPQTPDVSEFEPKHAFNSRRFATHFPPPVRTKQIYSNVAPFFKYPLPVSQRIQASDSDGSNHEMDPILLVCGVQQDTDPVLFQWTKNNRLLFNTSSIKISYSDRTCQLRILYPKLTDSGIYKCQAQNMAGLCQTQIEVEVVDASSKSDKRSDRRPKQTDSQSSKDSAFESSSRISDEDSDVESADTLQADNNWEDYKTNHVGDRIKSATSNLPVTKSSFPHPTFPVIDNRAKCMTTPPEDSPSVTFRSPSNTTNLSLKQTDLEPSHRPVSSTLPSRYHSREHKAQQSTSLQRRNTTPIKRPVELQPLNETARKFQPTHQPLLRSTRPSPVVSKHEASRAKRQSVSRSIECHPLVLGNQFDEDESTSDYYDKRQDDQIHDPLEKHQDERSSVRREKRQVNQSRDRVELRKDNSLRKHEGATLAKTKNFTQIRRPTDDSNTASTIDSQEKLKSEPDTKKELPLGLQILGLTSSEQSKEEISANEEVKYPLDIKTIRDVQYNMHYKIEKQIGSGRYGNVHACRALVDGKRCAIKILPPPKGTRPTTSREDLVEVAVLRAIGRHPQIASLQAVYEHRGEWALVMQLVGGGSLFDRILQEDTLNEAIVRRIIRQVLLGLEHLKQCGVVHCDLKPENLIMVEKKGFRLKLIDFGLAFFYNPDKPFKKNAGTLTYKAPEVQEFEPLSFATDLWSVAVIAYELLSGWTPFALPSDPDDCEELDSNSISLNITKVKYSLEDETICDISADAKSFISKILVRDPSIRPTTEECLQLKWLQTPTENLSRVRRNWSLRRLSTRIHKDDSRQVLRVASERRTPVMAENGNRK